MKRAWPRGQQPIWDGSIGVYGIRCGEFVKVGITRDARTRLRALELTCPYPMLLIAWRVYPSQEVALSMESALHAQLAGQSHRGEWFAMAPIDPVRAIIEQYDRERVSLGLPAVEPAIDASDEPPIRAPYAFSVPTAMLIADDA